MNLNIRFSVFEDEQQHIPPDARLPVIAHAGAIPVPGDVVFMSPRSAWTVAHRTFQQLQPDVLQVDLWLHHTPGMLAMQRRPPPALVAPPPGPAGA